MAPSNLSQPKTPSIAAPPSGGLGGDTANFTGWKDLDLGHLVAPGINMFLLPVETSFFFKEAFI